MGLSSGLGAQDGHVVAGALGQEQHRADEEADRPERIPS
jgi:hypothetical protein